jgi:hypothetical protein
MGGAETVRTRYASQEEKNTSAIRRMARHVGTDWAGTAQSLPTTGTIVAAIACGGLAIRTQTLVKRQQIRPPQMPNNRRAAMMRRTIVRLARLT